MNRKVDLPRLTVAGHPLHAILSDWPVALLSSASIFDALFLKTGKQSYATTAQHLQAGGLFSGLFVGLAGAADYSTISNRDLKLKADARAHALFNIGVIGLTAATLVLRKKRPVPSGKLPFFLSTLSSVGLVISAWYGGELVYRHGMRVKGVSPVEETPEFEIPGSARMGRVLSRFSSLFLPTRSSKGLRENFATAF